LKNRFNLNRFYKEAILRQKTSFKKRLFKEKIINRVQKNSRYLGKKIPHAGSKKGGDLGS
jgi:hypothetical protein